MTHLEEFMKILEGIHEERPDTEQIKTWFLGTIAANTSAILDILEDMTNGDKL